MSTENQIIGSIAVVHEDDRREVMQVLSDVAVGQGLNLTEMNAGDAAVKHMVEAQELLYWAMSGGAAVSASILGSEIHRRLVGHAKPPGGITVIEKVKGVEIVDERKGIRIKIDEMTTTTKT